MTMTEKEKIGVTSIVRPCYACGGEMTGNRENYRYTECGLQSVVLMNVLVFHCPKCSAIVPEIPDAAWLHRRISVDLLKKETLLSAEEIKFIRKVAGYSATELARVMGTSKVTVSRWENKARQISKENDRLLRLICFTSMIQRTNDNKDAELPVNIAKMARVLKSLDVAALLENIQNRIDGSKQVTIDPSSLLGLGEHVRESGVAPVVQ
jgi:putative zinc finger/helix-turn-helix YgiT family protein